MVEPYDLPFPFFEKKKVDHKVLPFFLPKTLLSAEWEG